MNFSMFNHRPIFFVQALTLLDGSCPEVQNLANNSVIFLQYQGKSLLCPRPDGALIAGSSCQHVET